MHVVVIGYVWPEPHSSAAGQNMLNLLRCFSDNNWQVTFCSAAKHSEFEVSLADLSIDTHDINLNCASFDDLMLSLAPEIVVFDRFMIEEQFGWRVANACPNALRVLNTEDLHSLREERHRQLKNSSADRNMDINYREIAAILRCDTTLILSAAEITFLKSQYNIADELLYHWHLVPELAAESDLVSTYDSFDARNGFVFIGNYRHAPNWDAVLWLRQSVWPKIRAQLPSATLSVYGAYQPPKASQLHSPKDGFLIQGRASSAAKVMSEARICLAPLRFGAGVKGKLLDAISAHTPSVTTTVGIEGIETAENWPGYVADDALDIANHAVELHQNKPVWEKASKQCTNMKEAMLSNSMSNKVGLLSALSDAHLNLAQRRKRNFLGGMLQHHTMASTRYMTQWIEAKNR